MTINVLSVESKCKAKYVFKGHRNPHVLHKVGFQERIHQNQIYPLRHFLVSDLEKKIQDLNLSRQEKAEQLKQLEDQVLAIRNEIAKQENKYSSCYS